ncbi:MAG: hypothetical protein K0Q49_1624 [Haloplasmataceae bacterium]|nr:hypothetical protein [Haloplasmataceae bacterium]
MKNFFLLKLLVPFKKLFTLIGIDYNVMRCILQVKLTMDSRRVPTVFNNSNNKNTNKDKNRFLSSLLIYMIIGLANLPFILLGHNFMFQMSIVFGILMFMITTSMISDFSSVLLDIKEKNILHSKPINSKTVNMAKFIHILYYLSSLTLALALPALIAAFIKFGFMFLFIFIIELIFINLLIIFFTSFLYLVILKFFDGEKLKDMINYMQISLTLIITVGYQFISQGFHYIGNSFDIVYTSQWWHYLIPPMWFAAPFEILINHHSENYLYIFMSLALLVPILGIIIYIKLIPSFERNLQKLNNEANKVKKTRNIKITQLLMNVICRNKEERIFFRFSSEMMKNEREFKLKAYPSLGFALIFPFIFMFNFSRIKGFEGLSETKYYFNIYFCTIMMPAIIMILRYSSNYKAAWVYKTVPLKKIRSIITGTLKAFIVKLLLPIFLLESVIFLSIFGLIIWIDILIVFITILIFINLCFNILEKALPFSESNEEQVNQGGTALLLMFIILLFASMHFGATFINYGTYIYALILIILNFFLWKYNFIITWDELENEN